MKLVIFAAVMLSAIAAIADDQPVLTDQERADAILHLHWVDAGTYKLPASNAALALPHGYRMVLGEDARRLVILSGNPSGTGVEAVVVSPNFEDEIVFQSVNEGYVSLEDWSDIDPNSGTDFGSSD
jgi:hypothetical protein